MFDPSIFGAPRAGLNGTFAETCVSCLQPTDTAIGVRAEAEFHIAFLMQFNIPNDQAGGMVSLGTGCDDGKVPGGVFEAVYRVCTDCATNTPKMPKPTLMHVGAQVVCIGEKV